MRRGYMTDRTRGGVKNLHLEVSSALLGQARPMSFASVRDEGDKFKLDEALEADALLLGRVTYEGFAEAWPTRDGEFADKFNNMPKYVVSSTLDATVWRYSSTSRRARTPRGLPSRYGARSARLARAL